MRNVAYMYVLKLGKIWGTGSYWTDSQFEIHTF